MPLVVLLLMLDRVDDRRGGGRENNPLDFGPMRLDGLENARRSLDRGIKKVFHGVIDPETVRGCSVYHVVERVARDRLVGKMA